MIVKNEADLLDRCLASVADFVDEIVIVDTGSTDRTVDIATSYGAIVIHHQWQDDFAEARNLSLAHATGDWILWMDADEELESEDGPTLRETIEVSEEPILLIQLTNYYGSAPPDSNRAYQIAHHRLFRNGRGFRFAQPIHEQLNAEAVLGSVPALRTLPVRIYHYGYMDEIKSSRGKAERNIEILLRQKVGESYSPWVDYHLASEWMGLKKVEAALGSVNLAIARFLARGQLPPSITYKLKYALLLESGHADRVWPAVDKAIRIYPDYVDLYFYKGLARFLLGQYEDAAQTFSECLAIGDDCSLHLTMKGAGSFLPYYYRGQCRQRLGIANEALEDYEAALRLYPQFEEAAQAVRALHTARERGCR